MQSTNFRHDVDNADVSQDKDALRVVEVQLHHEVTRVEVVRLLDFVVLVDVRRFLPDYLQTG